MTHHKPAHKAVALFVSLYLVLSATADDWKVEKILSDLQTAEGPVWDGGDKLFFTEIFAHKVHEYSLGNGKLTTIRTNSGGSNGMALDSQNRLLMCEMLGKRVTRMNPDGSSATLWKSDAQKKGGPNDITISRTGTAYFTMPSHQTVYRIDTDDTIHPAITQLPGINGVILSHNEKTLYVTEYRKRRINAFPIDIETNEIGPRSHFASITTEGTKHGADGMAVDQHNQLYVACLDGVWIYNASGNQTGFIPLPNEKVTNCAFTDPQDKILYITTQQGLFKATRTQ